MERGREEDEENCRNRAFRGLADHGTDIGGAAVRLDSDVHRLDHADCLVAGPGDLRDPVPGRCLERHPVPLQSRLRDAGLPEPGPGCRRPGHRRLAAQPWVRAGGVVVRDDRLGDPAGAARPDRHAGRLRRNLRDADADDRVGPLARRHHHGRPDPAVPGPVQRRAADVRRALRRGGHLEHRPGRRVRVQAADRPERSVAQARQHHQPGRQPDRRRDRRGWRAADPAGAGAAPPPGGARRALAAALGDTPGWCTPLSPEPASNDFAGQEANQYQWQSQVDFPFVFALRAELEARAGGNPSWNTGVNYFSDLAKSADLREVVALYKAAGLSLRGDLETLNHASRISADPSAVRYMEHNIAFDGRLPVPVLTMHTTGDGLVVPQNEQAYRSVVDRAGDERLLRQIFVHRAGHCTFTPAETITAARVLLNRLDTGRWDGSALAPEDLNSQAAALGPGYNIFLADKQVVPTAPAFVRYHPTVYLRPFDLDR